MTEQQHIFELTDEQWEVVVGGLIQHGGEGGGDFWDGSEGYGGGPRGTRP